MLSRKLLSIVAAGLLSVAVVPSTWGRTHTHRQPKTATTTSKSATAAAQKGSKKPAAKTPARKLTTHHRAHSKHATTKLVSKKIVRRSPKLSHAKHPAHKALAKTSKSAK